MGDSYYQMMMGSLSWIHVAVQVDVKFLHSSVRNDNVMV